ncbi:MAG: amino acid permease [Planctomycetia bacterium]|nr:amino acid permease [Planctomycetia bacterium]
MADERGTTSGFQQKLGLFDATMLIAGTMIGSGIFIVSADIARDVGASGWLLAVWVMTGVVTIMGGLAYAELAAMMPRAGGQYVFLREAFSPLWGFLYGWTVLLVIQTGSIAAVSVAFAKFLGVLVPQLGTGEAALLMKISFDKPVQVFLPLPWSNTPLQVFERTEFTIHAGQLVGVAVIVLLTWLNCRGVREGSLIQNVFGLAKTLGLMVLIFAGLFAASSAVVIASNQSDPWTGILTTPRFADVKKLVNLPPGIVALMVAGGAMVGALFSADAWNNVTFTAGEVKNPQRTLPLSLILGPGLVIGLYLLANLSYLAALPLQTETTRTVTVLEERAKEAERAGDEKTAKALREEAEGVLDRASVLDRGISRAKGDRVATAVMSLTSPGVGVWFIAVAVMISTFGCVNGMILMGARLYYAMAQDGLFFSQVGSLNTRGVPAAGLIIQSAWSILLVFSGSYNELLDYVIFAALLFYALTVSGLFVLRYKQPNLPRPVKAFGYPTIPALYVVFCTLIMLDLLIVRPEYTWPGLVLVLAGIPVYFVWRLLGRKPVADSTH